MDRCTRCKKLLTPEETDKVYTCFTCEDEVYGKPVGAAKGTWLAALAYLKKLHRNHWGGGILERGISTIKHVHKLKITKSTTQYYFQTYEGDIFCVEEKAHMVGSAVSYYAHLVIKGRDLFHIKDYLVEVDLANSDDIIIPLRCGSICKVYAIRDTINGRVIYFHTTEDIDAGGNLSDTHECGPDCPEAWSWDEEEEPPYDE